VFFLNLPLGLFSLLLMAFAFRETFKPEKRRVDWGGALSFLICVASLLIALLIAGERGLFSPLGLSFAALFAACMIVFLALSRRSAEPFIPPDLFRNRLLLVVNVYTFLAYAFPIAATIYVPLWLQALKNQLPVVSGYAVAMATIGWPLGSAAAGKLLRRFPPGRIVVSGTGLLVIGGLVLAVIPAAAPVPTFYVVMLAAGFGFGISRTVMTILMQSAVENRQRGMAMSTNALMNTLGQTVFAAIFGAMFNEFVSGDESGALAPGIRAVFLLVFAVMALTLPRLLRMPAVSGRELFGGRQSAGERQD
jgi:predicted MFS family arabinose efflux permease